MTPSPDHSTRRPSPARRAALALGLPAALVLLAVVAVPADAPGWLGIGARIWALFACAPLTSLCLAACWRLDREQAGDDRP